MKTEAPNFLTSNCTLESVKVQKKKKINDDFHK